MKTYSALLTENITKWIDRTSGICGLYASQLLPSRDLKTVEMYRIFQTEMYQKAAALGV